MIVNIFLCSDSPDNSEKTIRLNVTTKAMSDAKILLHKDAKGNAPPRPPPLPPAKIQRNRTGGQVRAKAVGRNFIKFKISSI
jgi:hypothetical protein